jgi:FkbM family methyltransferase
LVSEKQGQAQSDDGVAMRFFWNGCYEKATLLAWAHFARKSDVIIDVGAHTGSYTLAAAAARPDAAVISFEPHSMNFARLNLNLRANGFPTNRAFMVGVGAKNEVLPFSVSTSIDYLSTGGSIGQRNNAQTSNIQVVALDRFIKAPIIPKVGLIKIDVEGHEGACIAGMTEIIQHARPVIFFECIDAAAGKAVQDGLQPNDYVFYEIDDDANTIEAIESVVPRLNHDGRPLMNRLNRIAIPSEKVGLLPI